MDQQTISGQITLIARAVEGMTDAELDLLQKAVAAEQDRRMKAKMALMAQQNRT